uniref:Hypothetical conserved protein n=1 Tax=uncultured Planctomycetota bacterium TaxID=120965 RepID=H5SDF5_9BACT|nr:hypothetical conserved protein [uncultured Planctomycetota bacterium]
MPRVSLNWVGKTVGNGRYRIEERLGEGGMGTVYRAIDLSTGKVVALKTPRIALLEDPSFFKRFQREMKALLQLHHPHIVPLLDVGEHNKIPFLVMPFLSGGNLRQRWENRRASGVADLFPWLEQVASALDYLHAHNVIHRDVKPDNVLFDEQGMAYLTDLGAVKVQEGSDVQAQTKLTQTGTALGTPPYMAPELIFGKPYDGRVDQYALAVMVYEALGGRYPYEASSLPTLIQSLMGREAERLDRLCAVPVGVADAVARGLARDPKHRFPSCADFARAVRRGFTTRATPRAGASSAEAQVAARSGAKHTPATGTPVSPSSPVPPAGTQQSASVVQSCPSCGKTWKIAAASLFQQCPCCRAALPSPVPASSQIVPPAAAQTPTLAAPIGRGAVTPLPQAPAGSPLLPGVPSADQPSPVLPSGVPYTPAPVVLPHQLPAPLFPRSTGNSLQRWKRLLTQPPVLYSLIAVGTLFIGSFVFLLLILLAGGPSSETKPAGTVAVSDGGDPPAPQSWRVSLGGMSLPEAVQKARPGDIIEIAAGEYTLRQSLVIDKSLTLRGAGRDQTRLLCSEQDFVIKFTGNGQWTLQGLTVEHVGNQWANVVVVEGGVVTITECVLTGGVWEEQNKRGGYGIWFTGNARGYVARCLCRNNGLDGIAVYGQAQPLLEGNTCENNKQFGIAYFGNAGGTARNNTCRNNDRYGIYAGGQAQPLLEGNTCENNKQFGIAYFGNAGGTARNNTCRNNDRYGIYAGGQAQPLLEGNTCENNKYSGIAYFENAGGTARNNTCRDNGLHGIYAGGQAQPLLEGNTCENNTESGIAYFGNAGGTARNNTCRNNGLHGIGVTEQAQPTLEGNTCENNKQSGIVYFENAGGTARNNTCRNNGIDGIGVDAQAQPLLEGNTCENNRYDGIAYSENAGGTARNNTCRNNDRYGIFVQKGARPTLDGNILQGNRAGDLHSE